MAPSTEQIEEFLNLMSEVDLPTLRTFDRRLRSLLKQRALVEEATTQSLDARQEFHHRHPRLAIDPELFELVGIHPENPVAEDKLLIREQIVQRLAV